MFHSQCPEQGEGRKRGRDREKSEGESERRGLRPPGIDDGKAGGVKEADRNEACEGGGGKKGDEEDKK